MQYPKGESSNNYKILVLGEAGVGKTCLLTRFADKTFTEEEELSTNANFKVVDVPTPESSKAKSVKLELYDTAGQERFRILTSSFYRKCCGAFLVFDLNDRNSFQNLQNWSKDIEYYANKAIVIVVGNKSDLPKIDDTIQPTEMSGYISEKGYKAFYECSAKTGDKCEEALKAMALEVAEMCTEETDDPKNVKQNNVQKKSKCFLF
ncbi:rab10, putative [Entamoeba invadens IP1]|uniref:Rab10, putative n=1 Tax=Entamoeba invadens IP1 TaxID=370355 RepID=A0A0A1U792_ENTIV|nr:rab10, putative [Entamoeba invadens IP1]ELP90266.1 rab10, putative [Entamoeba invadens IP1]|eukprot:XP_004257037.1 rab10, putative [Entamoeba invadens IP1]